MRAGHLDTGDRDGHASHQDSLELVCSMVGRGRRVGLCRLNRLERLPGAVVAEEIVHCQKRDMAGRSR